MSVKLPFSGSVQCVAMADSHAMSGAYKPATFALKHLPGQRGTVRLPIVSPLFSEQKVLSFHIPNMFEGTCNDVNATQ